MGVSSLSFDLDRIKKLVDWTLESPVMHPPYGIGEDLKEPSLVLVKDEGIYLMPHSDVRHEGDVVYAKGYDPAHDEDVWFTARAALGGDDFAEPLPLSVIRGGISIANMLGRQTFILEVCSSYVTVR